MKKTKAREKINNSSNNNTSRSNSTQEEICSRQKAQSESQVRWFVSSTEKPTTDVSVYKLITETRSLVVISCYKYNTAGYIYFACVRACVCLCVCLFVCMWIQEIWKTKWYMEQIERVGHTI